MNTLKLATSQLACAAVTAVLIALLAPPATAQIGSSRLQQMAETRKKLAMAGMLLRTGKKNEAVSTARSLFPDGPPSGEMALEYYRIVGSTDEGWSEARAGLEKLVKAEPYVMLYQRELAKLLLARESTRMAGIRALASLAKRLDADKALTIEAWREGLMQLAATPADIPLYQDYLSWDPENSAIKERLGRLDSGDNKGTSTSAPVPKELQAGLDLLEQGNLLEAESALQAALQNNSADPRTIGALGLLRLRQGRHSEAKTFFERALPLDNDNRKKWQGLINTATFWSLIRASSAARDDGKLDLAENNVRAALRLEPNQPDGIALLAGVFADRGNASEAERLYRESLDVEPTNGSAIRGLVGLLRSAGRRNEAFTFLASIEKTSHELAARFASLHADLLGDEADALLAAGQLSEAQAVLVEALQRDPKNPWTRFSLARLLQKRGDLDRGRGVMKEGLTVLPNDPQMLYANALFLTSIDKPDDALVLLDMIPASDRSASVLGLRQKAIVTSKIERALALHGSGLPLDALGILNSAEADAGTDPELVGDVARAWISIGDGPRALAFMRAARAQESPPAVAMDLSYGSILNRLEQDIELAALLARLETSSALAEEDEEAFLSLYSALSIRNADRLRREGKNEAAFGAIRPALARSPEKTPLLMAQARVYISAQQPEQARAIYLRILERLPNEIDVRLALAKLLRDTGQVSAAKNEIQIALSRSATPSIDVPLKVAEELIDQKDAAGAREIVGPLADATAPKPKVLILAGRIAALERDYDKAMLLFKQARTIEELSKMPAATDRASATGTVLDSSNSARRLVKTEADDDIARLEDRRRGYVASGIDFRDKPGTPGVSAFRVTDLPIEIQSPIRYAGHARIYIDPVNSSAGRFQIDDLTNFNQYGKVQALAPNAIPTAALQSAKGVALGLGYESDDLRSDIGTTPLGFPLRNIVGGIRMSGNLAPVGYSVNLSRRMLTSSQVAFAGARDPITGELWGGVLKSGVDVSADYYRGRFDAFANASYHALTGTNVLKNVQLELRTGMNWEFIERENTRFSAGVAVTHWRFRENLSHYTFGQGGYYSPQSYYSLSIPFRLTGRIESWSYLLRGSVSNSATRDKDMPYYPSDPALQLAAGDPQFLGGNGRGRGYSIGGALEYRVGPHLFVGGRFDVDRSAYYTPNSALFYARFMFDKQKTGVPYPPDPVRPYTRF